VALTLKVQEIWQQVYNKDNNAGNIINGCFFDLSGASAVAIFEESGAQNKIILLPITFITLVDQKHVLGT